MGKTIVELSMSLDGFVTGPRDGLDKPLGEGGESLFRWYNLGDVDVSLPGTPMVFHVAQASADLLRANWQGVGAMVAGRRMFDIARAWGGNPPGGTNCFIVTHHAPAEWVYEGSPFTFVTDGVARAVHQAKQAAGELNVGISSASIAQQCLRAGLLDEIQVDLAPVLLGGGVRLFDHLGVTPIELEQARVVQGKGVTHLVYRVVR